MSIDPKKQAARQKILMGFSAVAVIAGVQAYRVYSGIAGIDGRSISVSLRQTETGVFWAGLAVWSAVCLGVIAILVKLVLVSRAEKKESIQPPETRRGQLP